MSKPTTTFAAMVVLAVAGCAATPEESATGAALEPLGPLVDRMGRPEIGNFILRDNAGRDLYNLEDAFDLSPANVPRYAGLLRAGLMALDALDGQTDWNFYPTVNVLIDDFLIVDPGKPCDVNTNGFLDVERSFLDDRPYTTCGGRSPNGDAIDTFMTYFVTRGREPVSDHVDGPSSPASSTFPYLAEPHPTAPAPTPAP